MIEAFDAGILEFFQQIHNPVLTGIYEFFTSIGEAGIVWILAGILLLIKSEHRKYGCILLLSLLMCLIFGNGLLKNLIARPRPCWRHPEVEMLIGIPRDYSFPSGHTTVSFAGALVCYRMLPRRYGIPALVLAGLIGFSRLYLGVHFPSDVLGGFLVALAGSGVSVKVLAGKADVQ